MDLPQLSELLDRTTFWVAVNDYPVVSFESLDDAKTYIYSAPLELKNELSIYSLSLSKVKI